MTGRYRWIVPEVRKSIATLCDLVIPWFAKTITNVAPIISTFYTSDIKDIFVGSQSQNELACVNRRWGSPPILNRNATIKNTLRWGLRVYLHQASASTLRQLCDGAGDSVLTEWTGSRLGLQPIFKWHCCLQWEQITSVMTESSQRWHWHLV